MNRIVRNDKVIDVIVDIGRMDMIVALSEGEEDEFVVFLKTHRHIIHKSLDEKGNLNVNFGPYSGDYSDDFIFVAVIKSGENLELVATTAQQELAELISNSKRIHAEKEVYDLMIEEIYAL